MLRTARLQDKEELKALWDLCFDEEPDFLEWFFERRFMPAYCVVFERDGRIIGCAHSIPFHIKIRSQILPCAIISGVSTHPDYRRQGVAGQVMRFLMHTLRGYGIVLTPHRPQRLETYFPIGHYPVSDSLYVQEDAAHACTSDDYAELVDIRENAELLYVCYQRFAQRYSGIIHRSYADFLFKCEDYLSCDAKCLLYKDGGVPEAYCIFFETPQEVNGEELVACSKNAYAHIYTSMRRYAAGKAYVLRAAGDAPLPEFSAEAEVLPRGVMGLANASLLLSALGLQGFSLEITDAAVPENAGIYTLSGQKTMQPPQLRMEAGRLVQWAVGYRSINEIIAAGDAELLDEAILAPMETLAPCPCFIFDEY